MAVLLDRTSLLALDLEVLTLFNTGFHLLPVLFGSSCLF